MLIPPSSLAAPSPPVTNNPPFRTRSLSFPSTSQCREGTFAGKTSDSVPPRLSAAPHSPPLSLPAPSQSTSTPDKTGSCSPWLIRELAIRLSKSIPSRSYSAAPHAHILDNTSDATTTENKWVLPGDASEEEPQRMLKSWAHVFRNALPDQEERYLCILSRCIREFRKLGYEGDIELPCISAVSAPSVNTTTSTPSAPYSTVHSLDSQLPNAYRSPGPRIPISKVNRRKDKKNPVGLVGKCILEHKEYVEIDGDVFLQTDVVQVRIVKRSRDAAAGRGSSKRGEGESCAESSLVVSRTEGGGRVLSSTPQGCASASTAEERRVCSSSSSSLTTPPCPSFTSTKRTSPMSKIVLTLNSPPLAALTPSQTIPPTGATFRTTRSGLHASSARNLTVVAKANRGTTKTRTSPLASAGSVDEAGMPTSMSTAQDHRDRGDSGTVKVTFVFNSTTIYGENIYLTGSLDILRNWSTDNALLLSSKGYPFWEVILTLPANTQFSYTYLRKNNGVVSWEPDRNRSFITPKSGSCIMNDTWRDVRDGMRAWR